MVQAQVGWSQPKMAPWICGPRRVMSEMAIPAALSFSRMR